MLKPIESPNGSQLMTARILWFALLMSQFMLGFVLYFVKIQSLPPERVTALDLSPAGILQTFQNQLQNPQSLLLTGAAAATALAAFLVPKFVLKSNHLNAGPTTQHVPSQGRLQANFKAYIMRLALIENVAVIGFVQGFVMPGNPVLFIPFLIVSAGLHLSQFPKSPDLGFSDAAAGKYH
jgi:hypothetical protein